MKKQGYRESTIDSSVASLKALSKDSDLLNPEQVKENLAKRPVSENTKEKLVKVYDRFCRHHNLQWFKPRYRRISKIPNIPLEADIDQLIARARVSLVLHQMMHGINILSLMKSIPKY